MDNCKMNIEAISQLVDGELDEERASELRAHIDQCETCQKVFNAFSAISSSLNSELVQPPEMLAKGVMFKVKLMSEGKSNRRFAFGRFTAIAACLAIILFAAGRFGLLDSGKQSAALGRAADSADMETLENSTVESAALPAENHDNYNYSLDESLFDFDSAETQGSTPEEANLSGEAGSVTQFGLSAGPFVNNAGAMPEDESDFVRFLVSLTENAEKNTAADTDKSYTVLLDDSGDIPVEFRIYSGEYKTETASPTNAKAENRQEPLAVFAEYGRVKALGALLKDASETEQVFDTAPTYTIGVFDKDGKLMDEKVSPLCIWVHEEHVYFRTSSEGKLMLSAVKGEELTRFLDGLKKTERLSLLGK